jgi:hypothetical protein
MESTTVRLDKVNGNHIITGSDLWFVERNSWLWGIALAPEEKGLPTRWVAVVQDPDGVVRIIPSDIYGLKALFLLMEPVSILGWHHHAAVGAYSRLTSKVYHMAEGGGMDGAAADNLSDLSEAMMELNDLLFPRR